MRHLTDLDLLIAGDGPQRNELELLSCGLENVRFLGLISSERVKHLFQGARAVIVPSLSPETFGLVAAEALSLNVPVISRRSGALPELIDAAWGGELYHNKEDLFLILKSFSKQVNEKSNLEIHSEFHPPGVWFEGSHVDRYLQIITESLHPGRKGEMI
jgi:glycosyltransferase involved in cell wall biosynthesis